MDVRNKWVICRTGDKQWISLIVSPCSPLACVYPATCMHACSVLQHTTCLFLMCIQKSRIDKVSFVLLCEHPQLLSHYVKKTIRSDATDKNGYPILEPGEIIPDGPYDNIPNSERLPSYYPSKSFKAVPRLPFLRKVSHIRSIRKLKDLGLSPKNMDKTTTPRKKRWNNFAKVLLHYYVFYCVSEGIDRFSDRARALLVYLFHGSGIAEQTQRGLRRVQILTVIHHACSWGKHQFSAKTIEKCFKKLFKLHKKDPETLKLLRNADAKVSLRYKAHVEKGTCFRCFKYLFWVICSPVLDV